MSARQTAPDVQEFIVLLPAERQASLLEAKDLLLDHLTRALPRFKFGLADVPALQEQDDFVVVPVMGVPVPGTDAVRLCRNPDPVVLAEIERALKAFEGGRSRALN